MPVTAPHIRSSWRPRHNAIDRLVPRHDRRLRRVARSYGLSAWDVDDVVQATWVAYLEHGHALREPAALGAWLETTARRLSLRVLQRHVRVTGRQGLRVIASYQTSPQANSPTLSLATSTAPASCCRSTTVASRSMI